MKIAVFFFLLLAFSSASVAQKSETITIKLFFHPDKLDPDWEDCMKVAPVTRRVPKSEAVATVALQELLKGPTPDEAKSYSGFGPPSTNGILKSVKVQDG